MSKWTTELLKEYDLVNIGDTYNEYSPLINKSISHKIKEAKKDGFAPPYRKVNGKWYKKYVDFEYTPEELVTIANIHNNPLYLSSELIPHHYKDNLLLWDHQIKILNDYHHNKLNLTIHSRHCGISLVNTIMTLHQLITKQDIGLLIIGYKREVVKEFLRSLMSCHSSLPYYLRTGIKVATTTSILTEYGNHLKIKSDTKEFAFGYTIDYFLAIDAAMISGWDNFYKTLFPTMSAIQNSKIIISAIPNGQEFIYGLYMKSKRMISINSILNNSIGMQYNINHVNWRDVPGRGKEWADNILRDYCNGNYRMFLQEYEALFTGSKEWNRLLNIKSIVG